MDAGKDVICIDHGCFYFGRKYYISRALTQSGGRANSQLVHDQTYVLDFSNQLFDLGAHAVARDLAGNQHLAVVTGHIDMLFIAKVLFDSTGTAL